LAPDDERHVAHEQDAHPPELGARDAPLLVREPLEVHLEEDLRAEPPVVARRFGESEHLRRAIALRRRPGRPSVTAASGAEGGVERVIAEPARLARDEGIERAGARRPFSELARPETVEQGAEDAPLQPAHG